MNRASRFKINDSKVSNNHSTLVIDNKMFVLERSEKRELMQMIDDSIGISLIGVQSEAISSEAYNRMIAEARQAAEDDDCEMCGS